MPISYKDISELTEETNIAGTEKVPVSSTKYVLFNKIKDWIINSLKTTGLDLGGKDIKNGGFETFTTLPTTFQGTQITFGGKVWTWNVTEGKYKCDADYLQIGGRNLFSLNNEIYSWTLGGSFGTHTLNYSDGYKFTKSLRLQCNGGWLFRLNSGSKPLLKIGNYTLSFWYKWITSEPNTLGININDCVLPPINYAISNDWHFYKETVYVDAMVSVYAFIDFEFMPNNNIDILLSDIKLEQGDLPTDWTPAPEDKADFGHTHTEYLGLTAKAADSEKLNGQLASFYATQTDLVNALSSLLTYKGTKATFADLPASGNKIGDTWNVQAAYFSFPAGTNFTWDGSAWDGLGGIIGLVTQTVAGLMSAADKTKLDGIAANAISAITKAMVEAVLTGTITSHTHPLVRTLTNGGSGLIDFDEWFRFNRKSDYAQLTLESSEIIGEGVSSYFIKFIDSSIIKNGRASHEGNGIFKIDYDRVYEVMINVQLYSDSLNCHVTVELINCDDIYNQYVIKSVTGTIKGKEYVTIALTCINSLSEFIRIRVTKSNQNSIIYAYGGNKTWFSVHEIK